MIKYKNKSGKAGIISFEIGKSQINIQFADGSIYRYTDASCGAENIAQMKQLAGTGEGLTTFINQHVRKDFAEKLR